MLQLSQRPLTASAADAPLFADRAPELQQLDRAVELRFNTLVLADRGMGTTSLLHRVERRLVDRGIPTEFLGPDAAETAASVLAAVREVFDGAGQETVLLVDDLDADVAFELFGRRRDDLWQTPVRWVVGASTSRSSVFRRPPADTFFEVVLELPELSADAAEELLRRRVAAAGATTPDAVRLAAAIPVIATQVTPRTPRALLAAARATVLADEDGQPGALGQVRHLQQAQGLGRAPAMLFSELQALGSASASDEELLRRLGWTRGRTAQVLKQLEEAGLVAGHDDHRGSPGRPRRVYAVTGGGEDG
ncbi:MAG: hypothetical protein H0U89_09270 [Acidimicrobiia bacterium]|nr:hypothetical protein [Acidimicrobiia bacterium]